MADLLVRLWELPPLDPAIAAAAARGVVVRRALAPEKPLVLDWTRRHFAPWAAEVDAAFARMPVACLVAVRNETLVGFACHDAIAPDFFGPTGVIESARGQGIGRALALAAMHALAAQGYAYAIVGGVGPAAFYEKAFGATAIAGSTPGLYGGMLKTPSV
ncbi:MAG: GNAT family N-acetyltransferase [Betaproteobacteria bacterium]